MMVECWSSMYWSNNSFTIGWSWMYWVSRFFYDGIETTVVISGVVDSSEGAIRFGDGVRTFDDIVVTDFVLRFVVTGVGILDTVAEFVFWMRL